MLSVEAPLVLENGFFLWRFQRVQICPTNSSCVRKITRLLSAAEVVIDYLSLNEVARSKLRYTEKLLPSLITTHFALYLHADPSCQEISPWSKLQLHSQRCFLEKNRRSEI